MKINKIQYRSFLALIGSALLAHILLFNQQSLQYDELLMTDLVIRQSLPDLMNFLLNVEIQMPLPYLWSKAVASTIGPSAFWMRLPSLLAVLLMPWIFLRLSAHFLSPKESRWSLLIFLLGYPLFLFSTSLRPYSLLVFFAIVTLDYTLRLLRPQSNLADKLILVAAVIGMILLHPFSFLWVSTLYLLYAFLMPVEKRTWALLIRPMIPLLFIGYIRWPTIAYALNTQLNLNTLAQHFYRMSFLFSGGVAGMISLAVIPYWTFRERKTITRSTWGLLGITLGNLILSCALVIFFNHYIFPRHFIYLLPLIPLLTLRAMRPLPQWLRVTLLICLILALIYKSFVIEKIQALPQEINTAALLEKAHAWSGSDHIILSCGNCFTFYLGTQKHSCTRALSELDLIAPTNKDFALIVTSYADASCAPPLSLSKHENVEMFQTKGGVVYRMSPRKIH